VLLGTVTGLALMTAAKLGTASPAGVGTVATAPPDQPLPPTPSSRGLAAPTTPPATTPSATSPPRSAAPKPRTTTSSGTPSEPARSGWRDGTYAGASVTHKYGTLRVTIVISGGRMTDITSRYETSSPVSRNINADALPELRAEALDIQSARVHTVSGATYTSDAYRTSLQSALDRA
jgi:uncharacterized protein with FMN-binding domain